MQNKFNQFYSNVNGQHIEVSDFTNEFQCYDLAFLWTFVLGFPKEAIGGHLNAYQIYANPTSTTLQYFDLIPNMPDNSPQVGDLVVFGTAVGVAGHVCISNGVGNASSFQSFDQNWAGKNYATTVTHNYNGCLGWLRPKISMIPIIFSDQTIITPIIDALGHSMEVQAIRSKLADQDNQIANLLTTIDNLNHQIDQLTSTTTTTSISTSSLSSTSITTVQPPQTPNTILQFLTRFWDWIKSLVINRNDVKN